MEIIFVRHSEPDYSNLNKDLCNALVNLCPLSEKGIKLAEENKFLEEEIKDAIILSSPYTRALQTASIMSSNTNKSIIVEPLLHEWLPSKSFNINCMEIFERDKIYKRLKENDYLLEDIESKEEMIVRLKTVLDKYKNLGYKKIVIFAHSRLISSFLEIKYLDFCQKIKIEY